jgi:predicted transcriptional regulator
MEKRTLKCLSIADKIKLIRAVDEGNQKKKEIAKHFGIPSSTLSTILKNRDKILQSEQETIHGLSKRKKLKICFF